MLTRLLFAACLGSAAACGAEPYVRDVAANNADRTAMESRSDERSSRAKEKETDTTSDLRTAVATQFVAVSRRGNAVNEAAPNDATAVEISKVAALVEEYKLVASEAKHCKGDTPAPEPEPALGPTHEPNGAASES